MSERKPLSLGKEFEALHAVWQFNHALERCSHRLESAHGISSLQRWILRAIGKFPGLTPSQVADMFALDGGTITFALNSLEKKRLIMRRRVSQDRRRVTMGLTPEGRLFDAKIPMGPEVVGSGNLDRKTIETTVLALNSVATMLRKLCTQAAAED